VVNIGLDVLLKECDLDSTQEVNEACAYCGMVYEGEKWWFQCSGCGELLCGNCAVEPVEMYEEVLCTGDNELLHTYENFYVPEASADKPNEYVVEVYENREDFNSNVCFFRAVSFTIEDELFCFYKDYLVGCGDTPEEALSALNVERLGRGLSSDKKSEVKELLVRWRDEEMFVGSEEVVSYKEQEWLDINIDPNSVEILEDGWRQAPVRAEWFIQ
jgi:hypothetical protein